jgi:hypothetical protein
VIAVVTVLGVAVLSCNRTGGTADESRPVASTDTAIVLRDLAAACSAE